MTGRPRFLLGFLSGAFAVLLLGGTGFAVAAIPSSKSGAYTGCANKKTGALRVVNAQAGKKCEKSERTITWSARGPAGAQGPAGPKGDTGAQGPKGDTGAQGNANVHATVVTLASADFAWNSDFPYDVGLNTYTEYFSRYHDIAVPEITQSVLDSGAVEVYFTPSQLASPNQWVPMPFTILDGTGKYNLDYAAVVSLGHVVIHFFFTTIGTNTTPTLATYVMPTLKYKVVVIGGS
jgi:hypothetical protein